MTTMSTPSPHLHVPGIGPAGLPVAARTGTEADHEATRRHAAEIEYASWLPDAGAKGLDAWAHDLRHAVR